MSIPKTIYQTFKSHKLPLITRWYISRFRKKNREYRYEFYDDERIESFLREAYDDETFGLYKQLNIGAAKADFFRYAILLKKGGIYLDIDSSINGRLNDFIRHDDVAIMTSGIQVCMFNGHWFLKPIIPFCKKPWSSCQII